MREILFRAKNVATDEFVYGNLTLTDKNGIYKDGKPQALICNEDGVFECDVNTVGEFTGLIDKNGVKIFEGDIIKVGGLVRTVSWDYNSLQNTKWFCEEKMLEVIGNKWDNPELLEVSP